MMPSKYATNILFHFWLSGTSTYGGISKLRIKPLELDATLVMSYLHCILIVLVGGMHY